MWAVGAAFLGDKWALSWTAEREAAGARDTELTTSSSAYQRQPDGVV